MLQTMRLDVFLAESGFARSRTEAKQLIEEGAVSAGDRVLDKPAMNIDGMESSIVLHRAARPYASRGGMKLEGALSAFSIDVRGVQAIDVGASSGGFTDCLLQQIINNNNAIGAAEPTKKVNGVLKILPT